ncbi:MAG: hypothetical protein RQ729_02020 [Wenzhouxiangellaceae bacterium]|nr:hypothetical protein [Wenzhouxiangellaceae bacterium]
MSEGCRLYVGQIADKDVAVLRSLLQLLEPELEPGWTLTDDPAVADLVLIDVDAEGGAEAWADAGARPVCAAALTRRRDFHARFRLVKPIRPGPLRRLLASAAERLEHPDPIGAIEWLVLDEGGGRLPLAEHLRRRTWSRPLRLAVDDGYGVIIDPGAGLWYANDAELQLARLVQRSLLADEVQLLDSQQLAELVQGQPSRPLAALKWRAGLALGEGRLHPDLAGRVRFMLTHVPHPALADTAWSRLARSLIERPATLDELAGTDGIDVFDLAAFLNACHVCGVLVLDRSAEVS